MVAVIDVDVGIFLVFSYLACNLRNTGKCCFLAEICCLIVRRQKLKVAIKRIFHLQLKMLWVFLVPCSAWKFISTAIFGGVNIPEVRGWDLLQQISFQWGSHKGSSKKGVTRKMVIFRPPSQCHHLSLIFPHPLPPCHQANSDKLFWEFKYWEIWWRDDAMFALSFMIN